MSHRVRVTPDRALADEVLDLEATGFEPGQRVALETTTRFEDDVWRAEATFSADPDGVVDPRSQEPVAGDYDGVRPMGLFQFGHRVDDVDCPPGRTRVRARLSGDVVARTVCDRRLLADPVTRTDVGDSELVGDLFVPPGDGPHPGVVVLGGLDGGRPTGPRAKLLASRGYAVLALAYFGGGDLPSSLVEVDLGYLDRAIEWFGDHHAVRSEPIGILGRSRGAEAALQVGTRRDSVRTVVAYAPAAHRFQGIPDGLRLAGPPAWTCDGTALPYLSLRRGIRRTASVALAAFFRRPVSTVDTFADAVLDADRSTLDAAAIPVERVGGPVLFVSGGDDEVWPATTFGDRLEERLREYEYQPPHEHLAYEAAGHRIDVPYLPVRGRTTVSARPGASWALGGTHEGNADADADSWGRVLEYLDEGLRPETGPERIR